MAGGVTTILCMPDTDPVIDDVALVDFILRRARDTASVHVHPMAAMTKDLAGEEMAEIGLYEVGAVAFTNGKTSVANARVMRNVLAYAKDFGALIVHHLEDATLSKDSVMNEGEIATRLGLRGAPTAAETIVLERDIRLVELTGGRYHAGQIQPGLARCHSQRQGARLACDLWRLDQPPHPERERHRLLPDLLQDEAAASHGRRPAGHVEGVASGDIDVIVSAHDPRGAEGKHDGPSPKPPMVGAVGLETLLGAGLRLLSQRRRSWLHFSCLLEAMSANPAKLLDLTAVA
ncbi:MAG: hypothetical protein R3D01_04215 [Hyphomicrobiales bacterium]